MSSRARAHASVLTAARSGGTPIRLRSFLESRAILAVVLAFAGCSVLPPRGFPPSEQHDLLVYYDFSKEGPRPIEVPASGPDLTVLELQTTPTPVRESFENGHRYLHPTTDSLVLHVRYRVRDTESSEPRRPEWTAPELFPGATSIQRVDGAAPASGLDPGAQR